MKLSEVIAPHLNFEVPSFLYFCDFFCGPHNPPNRAAGPCCTSKSPHCHHFGGFHRPPQWAPQPPPWFFGLTSWPPFQWYQAFELKHPCGPPRSATTLSHFLCVIKEFKCLFLLIGLFIGTIWLF